MTTRNWSWLVLPVAVLLVGCPGGNGGDGLLQGTGVATPVVYTANGNSNSVSGFTIAAGGALTSTAPVTATIDNAEWLTVTPDGRFLYVSNRDNGTVSGFAINSTTGLLTPTTPATMSTGVGSSPRGITVTPNGNYLYVANDTGTIAGFSIGFGGALTPTAQGTITSLGNPRGLTVSPNGSFLYVANSGGGGSVAGFTIAANGTLTSMGGTFVTPPNCDAEDLVAPNDSVVFVVCRGLNRVAAFTIGGGGGLTAATPDPSFLTGTTGTSVPQRITSSPNGLYLYVTNNGDEEVAAFTIGGGAQLTRVQNISTGTGSAPVGITVEPNGQFVYVANSGTNEVAGFSIGPTGTLTPATPSTVSVGTATPIGIATPGRP